LILVWIRNHVPRPGRSGLRRSRRKARTMKHTLRTALAAACLAAIGAALLAGKDDIRRLRRMRSM